MANFRERTGISCTLEDAALKNDVASVNTYVGSYISLFKEYYLSCQFQQLKEAVSAEEYLNEYLFDKKAHCSDRPDYWIGYYSGTLALYKQVLMDYYNQMAVSEKLEHSFAGKVPHFDEAISYIYENEGIRHGKLADALGIEKSTLSGIMDKIVESGAATYSRPGKFKYYYLTPAGKKYYLSIQHRIDQEKDTHTLIEQMASLLLKDPNPAALAGSIVETLFEKKINDMQEKQEKPSGIERLSEIQQLMNREAFKMRLHSSDGQRAVLSDTYVINKALLDHTSGSPNDTLICCTNNMVSKIPTNEGGVNCA